MGRLLSVALALALFLLPLSFSYRQGTLLITPFEYQDFGNASLPTMDVLITMNCNAAKITGRADYLGTPISGALSNLKYVQYDNPLISSGTTNSSGYVVHALMGNLSYMTGIFIMTFEKSGFQRREAHFLITDCLTNPGPLPPPPPPANTSPQPGQPPPEENATPPLMPPLPNMTGLQNITPGLNQAGIPPVGQAPGGASPCPIAFVLLGLSLFAISGRLNAH